MERVRWALVSEWLVEDPWQFFEGVVEWRERERERSRSGREPTPLAACVAAEWGKWGCFSVSFRGFFGLSSGLQRAREFVKAFSERGGDLHTAQRQHREMILMPLHHPEHTHTHRLNTHLLPVM